MSALLRGISVALAGVVLPVALAAQAAAPLRLVRCAPGSDAACLVTRVELPPATALVVGQLDSMAEARGWSGALGGAALLGPGVVVPRAVAPPLRLLVLLDRSGSMIGQGIAFTRITLKAFIEGLDSATVQVAVAGFESRGVRTGIEAAQFLPPPAAARALASLPAPDPQANTALYSALGDGVDRLRAELARAPGARGAILLVTDGRNDVGHARDDPGLLAGAEGLSSAAASVAASGDEVWIMGVGQEVAVEEIRTLAGGSGRAAVVSLDPNAMAAELSRIGRELRSARDLTFGVAGPAAASLARAPWAGAAAVRNGAQVVAEAPLAWKPPLYALPAFQGVVESGALPSGLRDALSAGTAGGGIGTRWLIAIFLAIATAVLWFSVPRLVWIRDGAPTFPAARPEPAAEPAPPVPTEPSPAAGGGGLRRDLREAPPRKPGEITQPIPRVGGQG